jgi:CheY-like chemotaxis protein
VLDNIRVLVVDDNRAMLLLVRTLLRGFGIRNVVEAIDPAEALSFMKNAAFDLIITDLSMKPIDGAEFARHVRTSKDSANPYVPIIMMTGHSDRTSVALARDAGVNSFLVKPISARTLYLHVNKASQDERGFVRTRTYFGPDRRIKDDQGYTGPRRRAADGMLNLDEVAGTALRGR